MKVLLDNVHKLNQHYIASLLGDILSKTINFNDITNTVRGHCNKTRIYSNHSHTMDVCNAITIPHLSAVHSFPQ